MTDTDRRGAQVFADDLGRGMSALGHDVRLVALAPGAVGGLDVQVLGRRRVDGVTLRRLRRLMADVDVVAAHGSTTLPACALAGAGLDVPFVYRQISDSLFWANTRRRRLRVRMALARATRLVALWDGSAQVLADHFGVPMHAIDCIPNGVPVERFPMADGAARRIARDRLSLDVGDIVVAYVGALAREKGVDVLLDAMGDLADVRLLVAGDGPERARLERRSATQDARASFVGVLDRPQLAYAAADIVALPSLGGDSMPATLIEAGLVGRPAVATPVAAIPHIVRDGDTGMIVPAGDADSLAEAIRTLASDNELRSRYSQAARAHCEANYSISTIAEQWVTTLYRAVAAGGDSRRTLVRRVESVPTHAAARRAFHERT